MLSPVSIFIPSWSIESPSDSHWREQIARKHHIQQPAKIIHSFIVWLLRSSTKGLLLQNILSSLQWEMSSAVWHYVWVQDNDSLCLWREGKWAFRVQRNGKMNITLWTSLVWVHGQAKFTVNKHGLSSTWWPEQGCWQAADSPCSHQTLASLQNYISIKLTIFWEFVLKSLSVASAMKTTLYCDVPQQVAKSVLI